MKANDAILKNMQTNMTSLTNSNLELKNMFGEFMKMNTASSSGSGTLLSNTITNPKEDLKGITTRSGNAYQGPTIPTTYFPLKVVEREMSENHFIVVLPDEHQLRFSKYKTAQELWAAILKTFGANEATKKTKKNLLKQQYGNFKAEGKETLEQTFNILQVIVSQLEFMDVEIEQDDLNQKLLTSLSPEWLMHTIVWRNRSDLDTMSLYDLYNHLKVYEPKVQKKSDSHNMAFISSSKNSSGNEEDNTPGVPTTSTTVSTAGATVAPTSISLDTACAYVASQSQDRGRRDNYRQGSKVEEQAPKALMKINGVGWDWSFMANEEEKQALIADEEAPTEFALMAKTSADSEVFDNSLCSKNCLSQVEGRLVKFKNQEIKFCEKIRVLEFNIKGKINRIEYLTKELENIKNEKKGLESKLTGFKSATKDLDHLIGSQRSNKIKEGLGYSAVPPP
nr:hypothetical protein [Tanacetum cinerariifolium]